MGDEYNISKNEIIPLNLLELILLGLLKTSFSCETDHYKILTKVAKLQVVALAAERCATWNENLVEGVGVRVVVICNTLSPTINHHDPTIPRLNTMNLIPDGSWESACPLILHQGSF